VIFADTKWIYATYRIFSYGVKLKAQKMELYENKEGESIAWIHPSELWYKSNIAGNFKTDIYRFVGVH